MHQSDFGECRQPSCFELGWPWKLEACFFTKRGDKKVGHADFFRDVHESFCCSLCVTFVSDNTTPLNSCSMRNFCSHRENCFEDIKRRSSICFSVWYDFVLRGLTFILDYAQTINSRTELDPLLGSDSRKAPPVGKIHFVEHRSSLHLYHTFHRLWVMLVCMLQVILPRRT